MKVAINRRLATVLGAVLLAASVLAFGACGTTQGTAMSAAPTVPAAAGTVSTKINNDGNTQFTIDVKHLAPPEKVASGANNYVVWLTPQQGEARQPQNMGTMRVDPNQLTGEFTGITPLRRFQLSITAEPDSTATQPSGKEVLSAQVSQSQMR